MAAELARLVRTAYSYLGTGTVGKYLGAAASGLIDGLLIRGNHGGLWVIKNALAALLPLIIRNDLVEGFGIHAAGNTMLILTLVLGKRMGR